MFLLFFAFVPKTCRRPWPTSRKKSTIARVIAVFELIRILGFSRGMQTEFLGVELEFPSRQYTACTSQVSRTDAKFLGDFGVPRLAAKIRDRESGSSLRVLLLSHFCYLGANLRGIVPINRRTSCENHFTPVSRRSNQERRVLAVDHDSRRSVDCILSRSGIPVLTELTRLPPGKSPFRTTRN